MIICFTGGRYYSDQKTFDLVWDSLDAIADIYVGCAPGLDAMVREKKRANTKVFYARWKELGLKAGPIRNREMLHAAVNHYRDADLPQRVVLIAFPGDRGTNSCVAIARTLGIPVMRVEP